MRYEVEFCDKLAFPYQFVVVDRENHGLVDTRLDGTKAYFMSQEKAEDYCRLANMADESNKHPLDNT